MQYIFDSRRLINKLKKSRSNKHAYDEEKDDVKKIFTSKVDDIQEETLRIYNDILGKASKIIQSDQYQLAPENLKLRTLNLGKN